MIQVFGKQGFGIWRRALGEGALEQGLQQRQKQRQRRASAVAAAAAALSDANACSSLASRASNAFRERPWDGDTMREGATLERNVR
jgi:hypothetical protein